ncbi:family 78 glycoside hydrolase catalytic domain [Enterococcus sp. DIV0240d]|uniref:family 78 glycoside hydrolase catalytic domain n=1 Tax=Enterococcus sp. DIV0240d TaxID=2774717 RepID=UPI003F20A011
MLAVTNLKCNYQTNPIGIDDLRPCFSWQIKSSESAVLQQQYQIQVAFDENFNDIIWNNRSFSVDSVHIPYDGPNLKSRQRYYYRVKVWISEHHESPWSQVGFWEMGILTETEWKAEWITVKGRGTSAEFGSRSPFSCSKEFKIEKKIKKAIVYATSLGVYELKLNNIKVGTDYFTPGWTDYNHQIQYQAYDITSLLQSDSNKLSATVGEGWYSGYLGWQKRKDSYGNINAIFVQVHLDYTDGQEEIIISDSSWIGENCNIIASDLYNGEIYDAREIEGNPGKVIVLNHSKKELVAQQNEPVRIMEEIAPIALLKTPSGETVLDMGQNMVGWVRFKANGDEGRKLTLVHGEVLDQYGNFYRENLRNAAQKIIYICNGEGEFEYEPHFTFQGFRYVKLTGFTEDIKLSDFKGIVLHSAMEETGAFSTSDAHLNQLQHNILWGQKGNFVDVPTDCPQRDERLGWTADAQIFARTASFNMNTALFFSKWLKDLAFNQYADGSVPLVVPDIVKGQIFITDTNEEILKTAAAWGDAAVINPWTVYLCYGDKKILEEQYTSMKRWINYIRSQGENEYLWDSGAQLGDWLALDNKPGSKFGATDESLIATAYYAHSVKIFSEIAKILYKFDDYKTYCELHKNIKIAYGEKFIDKEGDLTCQTQTAHIISLHFDLLPEQFKRDVAKKLVTLIKMKGVHLDTGFVGTPYICHALAENGYIEVAYALLFQLDYPSWLYQVENGATTMWEHWDGIKEDGSFWDTEMNSFNHYAYGSIGDWMYQYITGIDILEAGYKKTKIAPQPTKRLNNAKASLMTMYGVLSVSWEKNSNQFSLDVIVPHNTTAIIYLPLVKNPISLQEEIIQKYPTTRFNYLDTRPEVFSFEIGSGEYGFKYEYNLKKESNV